MSRICRSARQVEPLNQDAVYPRTLAFVSTTALASATSDAIFADGCSWVWPAVESGYTGGAVPNHL
jgi:hypothetical protein